MTASFSGEIMHMRKEWNNKCWKNSETKILYLMKYRYRLDDIDIDVK